MYYNMTKTEIKQNKIDLINWLVSRPTWGETWRKYYTVKLITAARLTGGELVEIEKCHMERRFCFGYGYNGADFDNDQDRAERCCDAIRDDFYWFLEENLKETKRKLKWLRSRLRYLSIFGDKPKNPVQSFIFDPDAAPESYKVLFTAHSCSHLSQHTISSPLDCLFGAELQDKLA